ncbi:MAG TPA: NHL repeat-containing protein [Steroidobacteraceae bacterium]|jgi:DNA-binding beta-propeller fold protein YncE|nr:NHL repeat-containing protein [Steroidobacteraceae bacterium]
MHVQLVTTFTNPLRTARPRRALTRLALVALAWVTHTLASAQGLPAQQLTVAFTNGFPNGSVDALTMPNPNSAAIVATDPILTGGSARNLYTALVWVTNPATSTLDLIYADAEQHKIWRLPGPQYQHPVAIFTWSGRGSGPAYPLGLSADPSGNLYVISPSCLWDKPGVWVLPITETGTYGAPLLIDNTFTDPATHKPAVTLALAEVAAAGTAASPVSAGAPAWNALDLLVLVDDIFNTRVIRYSQAQIESVLSSQRPLQGPASTVVTQAQFLTQAIRKFPPFALGMDIGQDPTTQDMTLLFSTADGRILDFDSAKNVFITPYAINLGWGLTRIKVGTFQGAEYVFVGQLPGRILEFAAPPPGGSNTTPFAIVSKGVSNPSDLAVTQSGSTEAGQCINAPCTLLPQLSLEFSGPGTSNIPANAPIVVDSCVIGADPRVTNADGVIIYTYVPLDLGTLCANMPNVLLSSNVFGASGPTGAGIYVAKITSTVLNEYQHINNALTTPINNTLTQFFLNPSLVLGTNPPCGSANGPVAAWGPLPGAESAIPEATLIDITVACTADPPPAGKSNHPSVVVQGTVLGGLNASYIDGEFNSLQQAFNHMITPPVTPPTTQIIDPTGLGIVSTVQNYITNSLNYFNQQNYNCALNTLATGARYVNSTVTANPGDFLAGPPPFDDENPSGTLLMRFDHLYYDVNILAGNPPITTDALNPATVVPPCGSLNGPSGLAFNPGTGNLYVANYNNGQVLVFAPSGPNGQMVLQPSLTLSGFTNPVRLAFAPSSENSISGDLLVADTGSNLVSIFSGSTLFFTIGKPPQTATITRPLGVAADSNGFVYVAENEGQGNGGEGSGNVNDIQVYSFVTGAPALYATYDEDHNGLAFQSVGELWYNGSTNDILVGLPSEITFYTAFGGGCGSDCAPVPDPNQTPITSGVNGVIGIATDASNDVDVTNYFGSAPFSQFAPNTGQQTALTLNGTPSPALQNPQGVAVDAAGNIYVSNTANNLIYVYHTGAACNPGPAACYWYTIH